MINYNIINLIMDKKALKEWEERMIKINEQYKNLYFYKGYKQCLVMVNCMNKYCEYNTSYRVMFNYEPRISSIYRIRCKTCHLCGKIDSYIKYVHAADLSKNY